MRRTPSVAAAFAGNARAVSVAAMLAKHGFLAALLALAACASAPADVRSYDDHVLTSRADPNLALAIDPAFTPAPPLRFPIETLTNAERYTFIDAGGDRVVDRMIVVQFERAQEGSDFRFVFPSTPPRAYGAQTYRFHAYVYDDAAAAQRAPDREAARTRALLQAEGYAPPRLWRMARLARVSDPDGLTEVIIFYMENADAAYPPGPLAGADEDGDLVLAPAERDALAARLESVLRPVRG